MIKKHLFENQKNISYFYSAEQIDFDVDVNPIYI